MSVSITSRPHSKQAAHFMDGHDVQPLVFGENVIRQTARRRGPGPIAWLAVRYAFETARLQWKKHLRFRHRQNGRACSAYSAMEIDEFTAINARQAWANWRTIPRNLSGKLPNRPVFALDLCCGTGDSTEVLAWYCPAGSHIHGLEYNPAFVAAARRRRFLHRIGSDARTSFVAQSVLKAFCDERGNRLADACAELVNASGAISCHFDHQATARVAAECRRVLRPRGLALIDSGPEGTSRAALVEIFMEVGFAYSGEARSCPFDRMWQLCFTKQ